MESISPRERTALLWSGEPQEILKLELHDYYDVDRELFTAWRDGDSATVDKAKKLHYESSARQAAQGWEYRRVRVVSEPLSAYQRMAVEIAYPRERLRWLPRRLASVVPLPGNDCLIRRDLVMFLLLGGEGQQGETLLSRDPAVVAFCLEGFERAWGLALPHGEYGSR
ncbi:DUF6879 family protein [Actinocorallia sp. A-T 12471]|uniref:DUF6879 family protein n=1 Tax=Actinocorallia sp. A-T 12471 TaxID=3089813 RepID=UPI0029D3BB6A|nr:DUF6879 family protein [Actinocorallia sp. A-T 12471]MDX6740351.1 hypothetical protein [Actinocorallia sp. A-T 12471]